MFPALFFPYGILSLVGILSICGCALFLWREQVRLYHMLIARDQHWFPIQFGPILVDRSGKKPIAWLEITLSGQKSTVILSPKDSLYRSYVAKTPDNAIQLPSGAIRDVCVYGKHIIALRTAERDPMPLWGKAEFERDLTPPDPQVVRSMWRKGVLVRVMMIGAVPVAFFGLVFLFGRLLG